MSSQDKKIVAKTIAVTATTTIALTVILFMICYKCYVSRRRGKDEAKGSFRREDVTMARNGLKSENSKEMNHSFSLKNDDTADGFSLRKLEGGQINNSTTDHNFPKFVFNPSYNENLEEEDDHDHDNKSGDDRAEEKRVLEAAFHGEEKITTNTDEEFRLHHHHQQQQQQQQQQQSEVMIVCDEMSNNNNNFHNPIFQTSFEFTPPIMTTNPTMFSSNFLQQSHQRSSASTQTSPPPPPPPPPPPVAKSSGWISSRRTSFSSRDKVTNNRKNNNNNNMVEESSNGKNTYNQMKLKPLHWDKVSATVNHSTVWDEINDGSFRFDDELMERLFGYTTKNRNSPERTSIFTALTKSSSSPPTQIFLLEPRKSQNTAIVLRSLTASRREIIDALTEEGGHELNPETLERLTKISPTRDEVLKILKFDGNPSKLADAESFLFHVLTAVPSAFSRFEAMLFRSSFDGEVSQFRESLRILESACGELRSPGIFQKLLEAILRAGNKMNEGTPRGNAQGFNLNALKKLSDIRSNDGETNLLRFVVEQVARNKGTETAIDKLIAAELSSVKRAATIDHRTLTSLCDGLTAKSMEIRKSLSEDQRDTWFWKETNEFLEDSEAEIAAAREEQERVMEVVKRTTEYYQAGGTLRDKKSPNPNPNPNGNPFELFVIVKDFIDVVDQICVESSRKTRQKRNGVSIAGVTSSPPARRPVFFSSFRASFASEKSLSSSSEDDEF